jgi:Mce-associated membrane protein
MAERVEDNSPASDDETDTQEQSRWRSEVRLAVAVGAIAVVAIGAVAGWISYGAWQSHQAGQQRELFLRVARQLAQDFTTISYTDVESDVQRILDMSTGAFHDDFSQSSQQFIDHIKNERSTSQGTVTGAGLESTEGNSARALVAVAVKLSTAEKPDLRLNGFRLRIDLQRAGGGAKVSNVEYVP